MSRPRGFCCCVGARVGLGASTRTSGTGTARARRLFVFLRRHDRAHARSCRGGGDFLAAEALLGDLVGLVLDLFVVTCGARSSSRLRVSAATRSARSTAARCSRILASSSAILRSSASRRRASPSACARRFRSSSVSVCSTTPDGFGGGSRRGRSGSGGRRGGLAGRRTLAGGRRRWCGRRRGGSALAVGLPGARLRTFSTTTDLVRPWLKLWRTTPVSLPRGLSVSVLVGGDTQLLFASLFRRFSHSVPISRALAGRFAGPSRSEIVQGARKRVRTALLSGPASSAACTTFDRPNAKSNCAEVNASRTAIDRSLVGVPAQRWRSSLRTPSGAASDACSSATASPSTSAASTLAKPATTRRGLVGDRERVERGPFDQPLGRVDEIGRDRARRA